MRSLILLLPCALVACATAGSGGIITVDTVSKGQAVPGAICTVNTNSGSWNVTTPGPVSVGAVNGDLHVVCNREGYRTSEMIFRPSGPYGSSVGLGMGGGGGNVGVGVGLSVPVMLGGGAYPSHATVELNPE